MLLLLRLPRQHDLWRCERWPEESVLAERLLSRDRRHHVVAVGDDVKEGEHLVQLKVALVLEPTETQEGRRAQSKETEGQGKKRGQKISCELAGADSTTTLIPPASPRAQPPSSAGVYLVHGTAFSGWKR